MKRVIEIVIGVILLLLGYIITIPPRFAADSHPTIDGRLIVAVFLCGFLGFACVVNWRRPITTRVWLGYLCVIMICLIIDFVRSDNLELLAAVLAGLVAILTGAYAVTGYYPESFPLATVFCTKKPCQSPEDPRPDT
jgi:hypothetical protein